MKNQLKYTFVAIGVVALQLVAACGSKPEQAPEREEDAQAKKELQGTWINDLEGNVVFNFRGDTVSYDDSLSTPASFYVSHDTLFIENHPLTAYPIKKLSATEFVFVNSEGDEVTLAKGTRNENSTRGMYRGDIDVNQGRKIKRDTVMTYRDKRYHAYTQVNPTTYKVYRQTTNSDGLRVESVYYDNILYMALYEGQQKVFGSNITKKEFSSLVPKSYLDQAVLSDIKVEGVGEKGVRFVAVLTIPDGYTNYRVNIFIDEQGKKTLSL